jgi:hypothetical protein
MDEISVYRVERIVDPEALRPAHEQLSVEIRRPEPGSATSSTRETCSEERTATPCSWIRLSSLGSS